MTEGGRRSSRAGWAGGGMACGIACCGVTRPGGMDGATSRGGMTGGGFSLGEGRSIPCGSRLSGRFSRAGLGGMPGNGCIAGADCGVTEGISRRGLADSWRTGAAGGADSAGRTNGATVWLAGEGGNADGWRPSLPGRPFSRRTSGGVSAAGCSKRRASLRRSLFAAGTAWRVSGGAARSVDIEREGGVSP